MNGLRLRFSLALSAVAVLAVLQGAFFLEDAFSSRLLAALVVALLIGIVAGQVLATRFEKPLREIRRTTRAFAEGDLSRRARWSTTDELGQIASALNELGGELEERLASITGESEQLRQVLHGMVEGVLVVGPEGRVALANRRLHEIFDLPEDPLGRRPLEVVRSAAVDGALTRILSGEDPMLELEIEAPNRRVLRVHAVGVPMAGETAAVATFHDMTELRRLENMRRDFLANASHELKTPLTAIRGFAETLQGDVPEADRERYLGVILEHSRRLSELIDDLLELSRIESGVVELAHDEVELGELCDHVLGQLATRFAEREISTTIERTGAVVVRADRGAVVHVLENLLDNAAKYTEPGGKVGLRIFRDSEARGMVEVTDTGIGIPEADRARVFERFYRVDKARSRALGGTGLGLSIVRHLVESMHGRVSVESTPGKGSSFRFELPLA